jgi:protocatechuate 3,4-dioxygenase beta subunit
MAGTKLSLTGVVRDTSCAPIPGARVDFWQADAQGNYDNQGYRLRGYQLTDKQGAYRLETVVPGEYPGRTVHIHVKVTPSGASTLTTQLFEPGVAGNERDSIYNPDLLMKTKDANGTKVATFDFVVAR